MFIHRRRGWEIPEAAVTPEALVLGRRGLTRRATLGMAGAAWLAGRAHADEPPAAGAAPRNPKYTVDRAITPAADATTYNNYYEFGTSKAIAATAQDFPMAPWSVAFDGMVKQPRTLTLDDLLKQVSLEERVYRHRCVEAWAMTVPWTGFPMRELLRIAEPAAGAKYAVFQTAADRHTMPGLRQTWYPWPYIEGAALDEAANDLAFIATGLYGKNLLPQNGGPIRMVLPWKYGFKSGKAFVKVTYTDKQPVNFWQALQPEEYGFWANVNPAVPHPRWSQATERLLGTDERVPTRIYNGYGDFVAGLYADRTNEKLFM